MIKYEVRFSLPCSTRVEAADKEEAVNKAEGIVWSLVNNTDLYFNRALVSVYEIKEDN